MIAPATPTNNKSQVAGAGAETASATLPMRILSNEALVALLFDCNKNLSNCVSDVTPKKPVRLPVPLGGSVEASGVVKKTSLPTKAEIVLPDTPSVANQSKAIAVTN